MENCAPSQILVSRDILSIYRKKWEKETETLEALRSTLSFHLGSLANQKRMRLWLERKLDKIMRALENTDATLQYRQDYEFVDELECIVEITKRDVENEKRLRKQLEELKKVIERARQLDKTKQELEEENKAVVKLKSNIEITRRELNKETEYVKILEHTIADREEPLRHGIKKRENEEEKLEKLQCLECLKKEFVKETRERQKLEWEIEKLQEEMAGIRSETKLKDCTETEHVKTVERMEKELAIERKRREELERKLAMTEGASVRYPIGKEPSLEEDMQNNFLKCTLDKLADERKMRLIVEEKIQVLERNCQKDQAKQKLAETFLKLTQNELTEEREMKQKVEEQLAEKERQLAEKEKQLAEEEARKENECDNKFDEKLEALEKILSVIQNQHNYKDDAADSDQSESILECDNSVVEKCSLDFTEDECANGKLGTAEDNRG